MMRRPRSRDRPTQEDLRAALRLIVITDRELAHPRSVDEVVRAALQAGARTIQLRDKAAGARELLESALRLRTLTRHYGALLIINDRVDVALASKADGAHLGPDDLAVADVRAAVPPSFLIGHSTDDAEVARRAEAEGASYLGCGTVYRTTSKPDAGEVIGLEGLEWVAAAVSIPVVAIGGITPQRAADVARTRAAGVAVIGAVMGAHDPGAATRALLEPFQLRGPTAS